MLWRPEGNLYSTCGSDGLDADGLPLPPRAPALARLGLLVLLVRGEAVLDRLHRRLSRLRRLKKKKKFTIPDGSTATKPNR